MKRSWFANDDMPANILSRLSAKTLHCLKLVSKEWLNLISERSFVSLQLKSKEPLSGFFFQEVFQWTDDEHAEIISYIPVDVERVNVRQTVLDFLPDNVVILSLNNGLLCCRSCFPNSQPMLYVCNPLNKQWRSLLWPNLPKDCRVALAFDPFRDPIDISTDFNLVAVSGVLTDDEEYHFFFDIYSSQVRSWRRSKECFRCNHDLTKTGGILAEGILYWLTDGYGVLMFDPQNELSWLIEGPLPATEFISIPEMCIGESEGKLCYVIISEHGLQLWILKDQFAAQWDLKFYASLDELERENSDVLYKIEEKVRSQLSRDTFSWMDPMSFKDGMLLLRVSTAVYLYQFDTRMMKKLCDASTLGPKAMFSPIVVPYTMSLVPVEQA
ncbi:hypothetical protein C2S51_020690 [Perilla frutescens var. frutescens]|nr:hypothetical protein C2S51_020690 [Perilla frutescens var. frutescens]